MNNVTLSGLMKTHGMFIVVLSVVIAGIFCCGKLRAAEEEGNVWQRTYGEKNSDCALSVQQTADGGYIMAGLTESFGASTMDALMIKTDGNGDVEWLNRYGGNRDDVAYLVRQTQDGGYITAGGTSSFGVKDLSLYVFKTDASGTLEWQYAYGDLQVGYASSIIQTQDGGYMVLGNTAGVVYQPSSDPAPTTNDPAPYIANDIYLVKLDAAGNKEWAKNCCGGGYYYAGRDILQTGDGSYVVVGTTLMNEQNGNDIFLAKFDVKGNETWTKTYGDQYGDGGGAIAATLDGGYLVAGYLGGSLSSGTDLYVMKVDGDGNEVWSKTYGGGDIDYAYSIRTTRDFGCIVAGVTYSYGEGMSDIYLLKLRHNGDLEWETTYGGRDRDNAPFLTPTSDGGFAISACTESFGAGDDDVYLLKLDYEGFAGPYPE